MDKTEALRILTGLDDTGAIAEVHFDMSELGERAEAITQAHESEMYALANKHFADQVVLAEQLADLQAQLAMMAEALARITQYAEGRSGALSAGVLMADMERIGILCHKALSAAPKVVWHREGRWDTETHETGEPILWLEFGASPHQGRTPPPLTDEDGQQVEIFVTAKPEQTQNSEQEG